MIYCTLRLGDCDALSVRGYSLLGALRLRQAAVGQATIFSGQASNLNERSSDWASNITLRLQLGAY
eukprot:3068072-Rhodomonas_salina.1